MRFLWPFSGTNLWASILWLTDMLECLCATRFAAEQQRIYAGLQKNVQFVACPALIEG
jgi:hypothetical protein